MAADVSVGPFCVIQGRVRLGSGTILESHVSLGAENSVVEIGSGNRICAGAAVGGAPQDLSYKGEQTRLVIGNGNTIREMVTINVGTPKGGGLTQIGSNCLIMAYSHVAHDCKVGDHVVIANSVQMAGHVVFEDHVKIGGMCGFNQFVRVGTHAFVAADSAVNKDVLPYTIAQGKYAVMRACNRIGMERSGHTKDEIESVNRAVRIITQGQLTVEQSLERIGRECTMTPALERLIAAVKASTRGLAL
jgi:UDP-N-acetylglucosamine acyltransferase